MAELTVATPPTPGRGQALASLILVVGVFVVCLIRLAGFVEANAVDVLFDDQWDFLNPLFRREGPIASFFYQHGPPRMGLGNLLDWYLYNATSWDVRAVAWAAVVVLALATVAAVALRARVRGNLTWMDAGIPLLLLGPLHWESMIMTPSLSPMILPLFLTIMTAVSWCSKNVTLRIVGVSIFSVLNLFTGYGICATPAVAALVGLLGLRRGKNAAKSEILVSVSIAAVLSIAMAVYSWGYQWAPAVPGWRFPVEHWWDYPRFCALMFSSLFGLRFISPLSAVFGGGMLLLVVAALIRSVVRIWRGEVMPEYKVIFTLAGTALGYAGLTAIGRLPVTIEAAFMWRYMTLMTLGVLALGFAVESGYLFTRKIPGIALKIGWLGLTLIIWCNFAPEHKGAAVANAKRLWVEAYLKTHDLDAANRMSGFWVYFPEPNSKRVADRLRWLEERNLSFFRHPAN